MNGDLNLTELFDRYLEGELNFLEKKDFEDYLSQNAVIAERFRLHKEIDYSIVEEDIRNFREKLESIQVENPDLLSDAPMLVDLEPEIDDALIEQDITNLREQLDRIHASFIDQEESGPVPEYSGNETGRLSSEVDQAIMQEDIMDLRDKLSQIGSKAVPDTKPARSGKRAGRASVAAAVITFLILAGTATIYLTSPPGSSQRLVKHYYTAYDALNESRGVSDEDDVVFAAGLKKFNQQDYPGATEMFELAIRSGQSSELALLYTGIASLLAGQPGKAEHYLTSLDPGAIVHQQAEWYLAGALLAMNKRDPALALLRKIDETADHVYSEQAGTLIKKLKKHKE